MALEIKGNNWEKSTYPEEVQKTRVLLANAVQSSGSNSCVLRSVNINSCVQARFRSCIPPQMIELVKLTLPWGQVYPLG